MAKTAGMDLGAMPKIFYDTINLDGLAKSPISGGFVRSSRSRLANSEEYRYRGC
jgi:hypothetical protein